MTDDFQDVVVPFDPKGRRVGELPDAELQAGMRDYIPTYPELGEAMRKELARRDAEFTNSQEATMPEAQPRKAPRGVKIHKPTEEKPAVKKAKEKKLEVTPKFEGMADKPNPAIQRAALELKKVQKARTELSNEETRLNRLLYDLMVDAKFTTYEDDMVKVEPPNTEAKFKVVVKSDSDGKAK